MIEFNNINIDECKTGISVPKDLKASFDNITITNGDVGIDVRDGPSFTIPKEEIQKIRTLLDGMKDKPEEDKFEAVKQSSIMQYLPASVAVINFVSAIISIAAKF